jgi:hypothetical protein
MVGLKTKRFATIELRCTRVEPAEAGLERAAFQSYRCERTFTAPARSIVQLQISPQTRWSELLHLKLDFVVRI